MKVPVIRGLIERRILANFRVDPLVLKDVIPPPFRPQVHNGYGVAGICLIRLKQIRPKFMPGSLGLSSENAAHRIAVEWDDDAGNTQTGVYVPRRDTSARLNVLAGGRIFPGVQNLASFDVEESETRFRVEMRSQDGNAHCLVDAELIDDLPDTSIFSSLEEVSSFFAEGSRGFSPNNSSRVYEGLELKTVNWTVAPLKIHQIQSSFFADETAFPKGSIEFDNALLMRDIDHEWHEMETLCFCPETNQ